MRGLIVGKFYPPHRGHKFLIDYASARVDHLTVIICRGPKENPPAELRAAWLREIHPNVEVKLIDDANDEKDMRVWAKNCLHLLGSPPDVVFSSEQYGDLFASSLGCRHEIVDEPRLSVPVSGTLIRDDPFTHWLFLEPLVRAWYVKRAVLVGAESTGKTTLARALARRYKTVWVPEYAREYCETLPDNGIGHTWRSEEFAVIARTQCEREDIAARDANRVLFCDTDAFSTGIWHRHYIGCESDDVTAIVAGHRAPDLYVLTGIDTPFVCDGTRDGESIREWMHGVLLSELQKRNIPFLVCSGTVEERVRAVTKAMPSR